MPILLKGCDMDGLVFWDLEELDEHAMVLSGLYRLNGGTGVDPSHSVWEPCLVGRPWPEGHGS